LKQLIVNADDFGFTRDVNLGIVHAYTQGILTATTLMANGREFDHAVSLSREHPALDIGCHLVLIGESSLLPGGRVLPSGVQQLVAAVALRRIAPYDELKPQVEKILDAGIRATHLDTHKHTHLLPPVLDAVARLSEEFRIPWVRRPFDFPMSGSKGVPWAKQLTSRSFGVMRRHFHGKLASHGCRTTDHFAGFQITGRFQSRQLIQLLHSLPDGSTEFMCHPGFCTSELRAAPTRLKESRREELDALTTPEVRQTVGQLGISLVRYADLG
jgi:predicted glycoside hydrolase/deacetylase ChbG (UPF0249 family)